jgi:hypothetical protein
MELMEGFFLEQPYNRGLAGVRLYLCMFEMKRY